MTNVCGPDFSSGTVVIDSSQFNNNASINFGDYKFALVDTESALRLETRGGTIIDIMNDGNVNIESNTPLDVASLTFWKVVAACVPLKISLHKNGMEVAQAKMYAINKIHELLVKKDYEAAEGFAKAVLEGKDNVS